MPNDMSRINAEDDFFRLITTRSMRLITAGIAEVQMVVLVWVRYRTGECLASSIAA